MKNIKFYLLILICIGCSASKTEICLFERGIPSIVSEIKIYETSNNKIGTVRGQIKNRLDSLPNKEVIIFSNDFSDEVGYYSTDNNGFFEFQLSEGEYKIKFASLGSNDLKENLKIQNGQAIELTIYLGVADSWTYFTTNNKRKLKKYINKQNEERKRNFGG